MMTTDHPQGVAEHVQHNPRVGTDPETHGEPLRREPSIARIRTDQMPAIPPMSCPLNDENWTVWRDRMVWVLQLCGVEGYIRGQIQRPDPATDPDGAANWESNDTLARRLIANKLSGPEILSVAGSANAREVWRNLEAVYERDYERSPVALTLNLIHTTAEEGDNLCEHLDKLERYWTRLNLTADDDLKISDRSFKVVIAASLSEDWDAFSERHIQSPISSHQFIEVLKEQYLRREARKRRATVQALRGNKRAKLRNGPVPG